MCVCVCMYKSSHSIYTYSSLYLYVLGMSIYNVVLVSLSVSALSSLLQDRPTLGYLVVSSLLMLSVTGMLLLLFVPKVRYTYTEQICTYTLIHTCICIHIYVCVCCGEDKILRDYDD